MLLRHVQDSVGEPAENTFEAMDEQTGKILGTCVIHVDENEALFPSRPVRIYMELRGADAEECVPPDALLGAAVARARGIARSMGRPARIFTMLEPEESPLMDALSVFGFKDNDGMVCMRRDLTAEDADIALPAGCVVVKDSLRDPMEQKFFLERYNRLFNEENDLAWLLDLIEMPDFRRLLIVSPTGMAGEIVTWNEDGTGIIVWIHTAKRWRGMHVAKTLLNIACNEFIEDGIRVAQAEIQVRVPQILKLMDGAGFRQEKLICRLPGIDYDPN